MNANKVLRPSTDSAITRRDFVRSAAATATAGALAATALGRPRSTRRRDTVRVGLIGCGGRGTGAAAQALSADPDILLWAMGDAFGDQLETALDRLGQHDDAARIDVPAERRFSGFDNYKAVIDSGVDVVILATPPVFRPAHLAYAIERGKHVFCEKPVAVDAPGIRRVIELAGQARQKNLRLMSGFCWRYSQPQRATYAKLHAGAIGEIRTIQTTYLTSPLADVPRKSGWTDMEWQIRNWKAFTWLSGDHIVEQAIHAIDWIPWALNGELPVRGWGNGGRQCREGEWTGDMFDHFSICYEFAGGARAFHACRQIANCHNDNSAYFMGTEGFCRSEPWRPDCIIENNGMEMWRYEGENNNMYQTEHDELFAAIREDQPINEGVAMAHSTMLGIMGRMCAYTGRLLTWNECLNSQDSLTPDHWAWGEAPVPVVAKPGVTPFV